MVLYMAENLSTLVRIHPAAILSFSVSYQEKFCWWRWQTGGNNSQPATSAMYLIDHISVHIPIVAIFLSGLKLKIPTVEMLIVHLTTDF